MHEVKSREIEDMFTAETQRCAESEARQIKDFTQPSSAGDEVRRNKLSTVRETEDMFTTETQSSQSPEYFSINNSLLSALSASAVSYPTLRVLRAFVVRSPRS